MSKDELALFENLIAKKNRRLYILKEQEAIFGASTDPSIIMQIEDLEAEISQLNIERENLKKQLSKPTNTSNSENIPQTKNYEENKPDGVLKLLFLSANPSNARPLRFDKELQSIKQAIREAGFESHFTIISEFSVRINEISKYLMKHQPHIVHFSGHGTKSGKLAFENRDGVAVAANRQSLRDLFDVLKDNIRIVFLNSCYSELQAQAIAEVVDCTIGVSEKIKDDIAIEFAVQFYQAIVYKRDVASAFNTSVATIGMVHSVEKKYFQLMCRPDSNPQKIVL